MHWPRRIGAYLAAVIATALVATVLQTQLNLARLSALGVDIGWGERLDVTLRDLAGFAPGFAVLTLGGFLVAFLVTGLLRRRVVRRRAALYALAGAAAIVAMLVLMQLALGLTAIAAARGAGGFALLALSGALGGWLFARLTPG